MKYLKEFCAKKIHDGLYGKTYFGHQYQEGKNEFNTDWKLLGKDVEFVINPNHIVNRYTLANVSISKDEYWEEHKKAINKIIKLSTSMTEDNFLNSEACIKIKLDMTQFNLGVSLVQLQGIAKEYGSENIRVAGDGADYEYSEYTGGHDSEVIITAEIGNHQNFLNEYKDWSNKKMELMEAKKQAKVQKMKRI